MGAVTGMLGLAGGAGGTGFAGPSGTSLINTTNAEQLQNAYGSSQQALDQQTALLQALQQQQGIANQGQVYNQLQQQVAGTGPNAAQAMLANTTGQNIQNQAAMMAGQRGAGANVGLMARNIGQQGAGIEQNALGQAAALQAQQSMNALGQAGNMANVQAGQQIGQTNANIQNQMAQQGLLQNAAANQNQSNVAMQGNINNANASLAGGRMDQFGKLLGGLAGGIGASLIGGGGSKAGGTLAGQLTTGQGSAPAGTMYAAQGGTVPGPSSSVGRFMAGPMMAQGGSVGTALMKGGHVPGNAKVAGNSLANDTVDAKLSPGELVVDRETMNSKGKAGDAARFLAAVIAAKQKGKK